MCGPLRVSLADEVRRELCATDIADILAGDAIPAVFTCNVCGRTGDARLAPANLVLRTGARIAGYPAQLLALTHADCAPSHLQRGPPAAHQRRSRTRRLGGIPRPRHTAR
ncbi:MAG: hypothetical protein M3Z25_14100 [Actinomycetota bacterium]|nr:hypothetical protein [Actinomycetota bacterium]